ncbi:YdeI/OmpD-associated family protein [Mesorhizobium sp. NPDC059025]|uniref:YdeI/OmpD-associated family protein n=2 Tax=unclassified Mesorhizobium TaxID=325217 RepID=UPI0036A6FFD6
MTKLTRAINPMPEDVRVALDQNGLGAAYAARPDYQQNDYLGWISRAKREETRLKRLNQMLDELKRGGVYMNMAWHG